MNQVARLIATFFYVGNFPVASGTLASAVGLLIALCVFQSLWLYAGLTALITAVGIWAAGITEKDSGIKDPSFVVIDEVAGIMISFFMIPLSWPVVIIGFFLFRAFDMFKIPPADRLEAEGGGHGIMLDDVAAGLYTNLTLHAAIWLAAVLK